MKPRLALVISGRGSNMQSLAAACATGHLAAEVALVLSNRPDAAGLAWARAQGLPTACVDHRGWADRDAFDAELSRALEAASPDWIVLCGFMRVLGEAFVARHAGRLINIHPSLLPAYPGLHTHRRALADGAVVHGATVHHVIPQLDAGPLIGQAIVPVLPGDDESTLAARVLEMEHRLYPLALSRLLDGSPTLDAFPTLDSSSTLDSSPTHQAASPTAALQPLQHSTPTSNENRQPGVPSGHAAAKPTFRPEPLLLLHPALAHHLAEPAGWVMPGQSPA